jgi:hypothetical protein
MKKRLLTIALCIVLVLSVLPTAGLAADCSNPTSFAAVDSISAGDVQMAVLERMVDAANAHIDILVRHAQATPYDDVDLTLFQINIIVSAVFSYADHIGATVACEYVEYYIDGQYVLIDPIHVVR